MGNNGGKLTGEDGVHWSRKENRRLWRQTDSRINESKAPNEALDETNASVLSDFTNVYGLNEIAHRSWNHPELRRSIPEIVDRNWRNGFEIWKWF
jgi:hypothetical protein